MEFISRIVIIFKYEENLFMELLFLITLIKWIIQEQTKKIFRFFSVIGVIIIHSEKKEYEKVFFDCQRCFSLFFFFQVLVT